VDVDTHSRDTAKMEMVMGMSQEKHNHTTNVIQFRSVGFLTFWSSLNVLDFQMERLEKFVNLKAFST